ncbi:MAG: regulator [Actinobacteria bacterium HGW-Actinobacteria-4]|nr:MAG: regulator [Actinobacteria bacterium HGW-Actinobacteria-4]
MDAIIEVLPNHPFFAGLSQGSLKRVAACGRARSIAGGETLFYAGEHADSFYVVLQGRIDLRIHRRSGASLVLDTVKGGDVVGWSWLVEPYRWKFDALAVQDSQLLAFDGDCLRHTCEDDPVFGYAFLRRVTQVMHHRIDAACKYLADGPHRGRDGCY